MALIKQKILETGATGEYWRITQLNINYDRPDVIATLEIYKSKADRRAGRIPFSSTQFNIASEFLQSSAGEDILKNITLARSYVAIKKMASDESAKPILQRNVELAWFADSVDD